MNSLEWLNVVPSVCMLLPSACRNSWKHILLKGICPSLSFKIFWQLFNSMLFLSTGCGFYGQVKFYSTLWKLHVIMNNSKPLVSFSLESVSHSFSLWILDLTSTTTTKIFFLLKSEIFFSILHSETINLCWSPEGGGSDIATPFGNDIFVKGAKDRETGDILTRSQHCFLCHRQR